jgi:flagellar basal-body rod modification protein FlgD
MHSVSANYTMPTVLNSLKPMASNPVGKNVNRNTAASGTSGAQSSGSSSSANNAAAGLGSTFLNLLAQELQNQDPTAPVDSTAMVGQMISLNQLDQLISINQGITGAANAASTTSGASAAQSPWTPSSAALASTNGVGGTLSPSTAGAATSQLPFDPNTMMPLAAGNSGAIAATINSSMSAANLGLSGTNNNSNNNSTSGGK